MQFGKKQAQVSFPKTTKWHESEERVLFVDFQKKHECVIFQISREIILLPINNVHENALGNAFTPRNFSWSKTPLFFH